MEEEIEIARIIEEKRKIEKKDLERISMRKIIL